MSTDVISLDDSRRLIQLESVIERGKQTFVEVGLALAEIRDSRLYRAEHGTFELYCRDKWNFTRQYVNQIIAGSSAVKSLPPNLETMVSNSRQARELARIDPERRVEVLDSTAKSGPVTAKAICETAHRKFPPPPPNPPAKDQPVVLDKCGHPIPKGLLPIWERAQEVQDWLTMLSKLRELLERAQNGKDTLYAELNFSSALAHLDQVYTDVKTAKPYAVCACGGMASKDSCRVCKGRGLISEFKWKTAVSEEVKTIRFMARK